MSKARVHGIGGVFFKSEDPAALGQWYAEHLGLNVLPFGGAAFEWNRRDTPPDPRLRHGYTIWGPFQDDTEYFQPSDKDYMLNLRVDDLEAMLDQLRAAGAEVLERREDTENGKFGYVLDPEGRLIELWQPAADDPALSMGSDCA